jgi:hypothetical protein
LIKRIFGHALLLLFIAGFGGGGALMLSGVARQAGTRAWPAALQGEVTASGVAPRGSGSSPRVDYRYLVGTTWHTSSTIRKSGQFSSSDGYYASEMVRQFPVGPATVYVNPSDAADSVLIRGMDGHEYLMISFAFPFLAIGGLFAVCGTAWALRRRSGFIGGVRVFEPAPAVSVIRDSALTPLMAASLCVAGVAFVGVFVVLFALMRVPMIAVPAHLGLAAAAGVIGFVLRRRWLKQGRGDTVIDDNAGVIIPSRGKASTVKAIPLADVRAPEVFTEVKTDKEGSKSTRWWTTLRVVGSKEPLKLIQHYAERDAHAFTA